MHLMQRLLIFSHVFLGGNYSSRGPKMSAEGFSPPIPPLRFLPNQQASIPDSPLPLNPPASPPPGLIRSIGRGLAEGKDGRAVRPEDGHDASTPPDPRCSASASSPRSMGFDRGCQLAVHVSTTPPHHHANHRPPSPPSSSSSLCCCYVDRRCEK